MLAWWSSQSVKQLAIFQCSGLVWLAERQTPLIQLTNCRQIIWQINTHDIKPGCSLGDTGQRRWTLVHSVFVTSLRTLTGPPLPAGPSRGGGGGGFDVEGDSLGGPNADKTFFILFSLRTEGGLLASALILRRRLSSTITFHSCSAVRSQHKYRMKKIFKAVLFYQ